MNNGISTVLCPVKDLARAKKLYIRLLGVEPSINPYLVQCLNVEVEGMRHRRRCL